MIHLRRIVAIIALVLTGAFTVAISGFYIPNASSRPPAGSRFLSGTRGDPIALGAPTPHLVLVMLENKEYTSIVGNAAAPYFNGTLLPSGQSFTAHFASTHPSLPNYLVITSGQYGGCVSDSCTVGSIPGNNLFSEMNQASVSWKVYAESMPSPCYGGNKGGYLVRHNPPVYYSALQAGGDGSCGQRDVPLTDLSSDLTAGSLPDFAMVVPNQWDDMHSDHKLSPCNSTSAVTNEVCQGDSWLQTWIPQILSDGGRNDATVLITFDEGTTTLGGAGRVVLLEIGPSVCNGCSDPRPSNHYGLSTALTRWFNLPPQYPQPPELSSSGSTSSSST